MEDRDKDFSDKGTPVNYVNEVHSTTISATTTSTDDASLCEDESRAAATVDHFGEPDPGFGFRGMWVFAS